MSKKQKYTHAEKIKICEEYLTGKFSLAEISKAYGLKKPSGAMKYWIKLYEKHGEAGLLPSNKNSTYTKEFKLELVEKIVNGIDAVGELATKHNIHPLRVGLSDCKTSSAKRINCTFLYYNFCAFLY